MNIIFILLPVVSKLLSPGKLKQTFDSATPICPVIVVGFISDNILSSVSFK